jgi:hypothetical protein
VRTGTTEEKTLDHFLSSFREAGQLDSQGSFTMAGRKAAGKLAKSLLPDPADWILKVVQGACQARAQELRISQTSRATHIEFQLPYLLDVRALEHSLTQGASAVQDGIDDLSKALRVVGLGQDRSWVARLRTGETTHWVLVKDGEASLETVTGQAGQPGVTDVLIGIAFPPGQAGKVGGLVRFGAAIQNEHEALAQRARACSIPLLLDGCRLDTLQRSDGLGGFEAEAFLGVTLGGDISGRPITPPLGLKQSQPAGALGDRFRDPAPFFYPDPGPGASGSSILRVAFRYQRERHARDGSTYLFRPLASPSRVLLVRHGVVVGKRNLGLTEPIAVDVYLNANEDRTDLSGLEVEVLPEHVETARSEVRTLGPFLGDLEAHLANYVTRPKSRDLALYGSVSGLALLLTPWPVKLLAVGASVLQIRSASQQYQRLVGDCRQEITTFQHRYC